MLLPESDDMQDIEHRALSTLKALAVVLMLIAIVIAGFVVSA